MISIEAGIYPQLVDPIGYSFKTQHTILTWEASKWVKDFFLSEILPKDIEALEH